MGGMVEGNVMIVMNHYSITGVYIKRKEKESKQRKRKEKFKTMFFLITHDHYISYDHTKCNDRNECNDCNEK